MEIDVGDFDLPQDLERYKAAVKEFVQTELDQLSEEIEETNELPSRLMPLLKKSGLLKLRQPQEWGGVGLTLSQYWPIELEVAKAHGTIRLIVHGHAHKYLPILHHGSEEQKKKLLPLLADGGRIPFALTEPGTGTGTDIRTTAIKKGDFYYLNGTKHLITLANMGVIFIVIAYTGDRSLGAKGISIILVERDAPGFTIQPHKDTMGLRGCFHGILHFRDCKVPVKNLLGQEGEGLDAALKTFLDPNRLTIAVDALGACEKLMELSTAWAQSRVTFGRRIAERQATQQTLADMATDIYALRCMIDDCARKYDRGEPIATEASMCKLFGTEVLRRVSDQAILLHGGMGYTKTLPVERIYRDCRSLWFEEGTPTIQRLLIGRHVLGKPVRQVGG